MTRLRRSSLAPLLLGALAFAQPARALDPFEIQVYDGTANRAGEPGLELHVNHVLSGQKTAIAPELPDHHRTAFTLEPSYGVFDFWELGGYLQSALQADGSFHYAGVKLRSKFVTPPRWSERLRLGINVEFSVIPQRYEPDRYGGELRPIAAWEDEAWLLAVNPIVGLSFAGAGLNDGPELEPAAMVKRKLGPVALGVEYYAGLGPIAHLRPWSQEEQYLYETVDVLAWARTEFDLGIGEGLNAASDGWVAKLNVGYVWESLLPQPDRERRAPTGR